MNPVLKSFKFPRIHVKTTTILWLVFAFVVLAELFLLYKYLYLQSRVSSSLPPAPAPSVRIDFEASGKAQKWFEDRADFELSAYQLQIGNVGRENPFAEY